MTLDASAASFAWIAGLLLAPTAGFAQEPDSGQLDVGEVAKSIRAPHRIPLGRGVKAGYRYERATLIKGQPTTHTWLAVVGETKTAWQIETDQELAGVAVREPGARGLTLALVVDKKSHEVLSAKLGRPGEALHEVAVEDEVEPGSPLLSPLSARKADRRETLEVEGRELPAEVYVTGKFTTWLGKEGSPYEGVMLKMTGMTLRYELAGLPQREPFEVQGDGGATTKVEALRARYTNGQVLLTSQHPVVKALKVGPLEFANAGVALRVTSLRADAKPTLSWR